MVIGKDSIPILASLAQAGADLLAANNVSAGDL